MEILEVLDKLNIKYDIQEHKAVYTVDDLKDVFINMEGIGCKNLFLKDAKKKLFLYTLPEDQKADLKTLPEKINSKRLSFANENDLQTYLGLIPGAVTPLGIINDKDKKVTVVLDKELKNKNVLIHPNRNTATISIKYDDLIKFIKYCGNNFLEI